MELEFREPDKTKMASKYEVEGAVSCRNWALAERLIMSAGKKCLNYALFLALESIWFLSTREDLCAVMGLIEKIISNGACDFREAVNWASFLASFVPVFRSQTMATLAMAGMPQSLHAFIEECIDKRYLKWRHKGDSNVYAGIERIGLYFSWHCGDKGVDTTSTDGEIQLQLSVFKKFLHLAGRQLTSRHFSMAFGIACFPLVCVPRSIDLSCASGIWETTAIPGLLNKLVEAGADSGTVNRCLQTASGCGITELVRILLKVSKKNSLDVDVDKAFHRACKNSMIGTMECLVEDVELNAEAFSSVLRGAVHRGHKPAFEWLVKRGLRFYGHGDIDLSFYLEQAICIGNIDVVADLLPQVSSDHRELMLGKVILTGVYSFDGIAYLLRSDFLGDPADTYEFADGMAFYLSIFSRDAPPKLIAFFQKEWSEKAFLDGIKQGQEHYMNILRILKWGESPICLDRLAPGLRVAIAYLPLYKECVNASGSLVSQRLRGQLVEAVRRLGGGTLDGVGQCTELLAVLKNRLQLLLH